MAWLIAYLASPAGDFFSGAVLTIDGARDNWFGPWPPPGLTDECGRAAGGGGAPTAGLSTAVSGAAGEAPARPSRR